MSKNYMKEVAEILGVELGEKFEIENALCNPCYINENGLYDCDDDCRNNLLVYLLTAQEKLKKSILDDKEREYLASVIAPGGIYENVSLLQLLTRKDFKHIYLILQMKTCTKAWKLTESTHLKNWG